MHVVEEIQHSDLNCDDRTWMRPPIVTERPGDIKVILQLKSYVTKIIIYNVDHFKSLTIIPFKRIIWNWVVIQFGNILMKYHQTALNNNNLR